MAVVEEFNGLPYVTSCRPLQTAEYLVVLVVFLVVSSVFLSVSDMGLLLK